MKNCVHGKEKRISLGVYPKMSLATRHKAKEFLRQSDDPGVTAGKKKIKAHIGAETTLKLSAATGTNSRRWQASHAERVMRFLEADIFPVIGYRPIAEIEPPEVLAMVRQAE